MKVFWGGFSRVFGGFWSDRVSDSDRVLPDGLDQSPPREILFTVILIAVKRKEVFNKG